MVTYMTRAFALPLPQDESVTDEEFCDVIYNIMKYNPPSITEHLKKKKGVDRFFNTNLHTRFLASSEPDSRIGRLYVGSWSRSTSCRESIGYRVREERKRFEGIFSSLSAKNPRLCGCMSIQPSGIVSIQGLQEYFNGCELLRDCRVTYRESDSGIHIYIPEKVYSQQTVSFIGHILINFGRTIESLAKNPELTFKGSGENMSKLRKGFTAWLLSGAKLPKEISKKLKRKPPNSDWIKEYFHQSSCTSGCSGMMTHFASKIKEGYILELFVAYGIAMGFTLGNISYGFTETEKTQIEKIYHYITGTKEKETEENNSDIIKDWLG